MTRLDLSAVKIEKPASAFPDWADFYFCDNCKEDLTRQLHRPQAHSWTPMGHETYTCACGKTYPTGAVEWDHLSAYERRRRIRQTHGLGLLFSAFIAVPGLIFYLLSALLFHRRWIGAAVSIAILVPFAISAGTFWFGVARSKLRLRSLGKQ